MRTIRITSAILIVGCGIVLASCSDDNSSKPSNSGGSGGYAGGSIGGSSNRGGSFANGTSGDSSGAGAGANAGTAAGASSGGSENAGAANTNALAGTSNGGYQSSGVAGAPGNPVPCTPTNDTCPSGQYCVSAAVCVSGCRTGASCTSGVCLPDHSCQACVSDLECSNGKVCASGTCSVPCSTTTNGTAGSPATSPCTGGLTCCDGRCSDTTVDNKQCLGCGVSCQSSEFCGTSGCAAPKIENLCEIPRVTGLLVENADDAIDDAQTTVLVNAFSRCNPAPASSFSGQSTGTVVNRTTGQPVSRGALLAVAGGQYFQRLVDYLSDQSLLPVYDVWDWTNSTVTVLSRRDNSVLRKINFSEMSNTRDLIIVEVAVEPITGTPALVAFGADKGTPAATWYFANFVMTDATAATKTWFVCDWTDRGVIGPDAADLWDCTSG